MTKADIIELVYDRLRLPKKDCADLVGSVFETVKGTLAAGENLKISGFGNFTVRKKNDRKGRNPQTDTEITIEARRVVSFKPSMVLKQVINKPQFPGTAVSVEYPSNCGMRES